MSFLLIGRRILLLLLRLRVCDTSSAGLEDRLARLWMLLQMSRGQRLELLSANGRLSRLCRSIKVLFENRTLIRLRRAAQ